MHRLPTFCATDRVAVVAQVVKGGVVFQGTERSTMEFVLGALVASFVAWLLWDVSHIMRETHRMRGRVAPRAPRHSSLPPTT